MEQARDSGGLGRAERADRYRAAVEQIVDYAVFLLDAEGIILDWNRAAEAMKGYRATEAVGQYFGMLYPEFLQAHGSPRVNLEAAAREGNFQEEMWRRRKDGSLFWAHVELIALYDGSGGIRGFCKFTQDLTERKLLEDCLRETQQQTERILEVAHAAAWQWDSETDEMKVSPNLVGLLGYSDDEIGRMAGDWVSLVHPADLPALQRAFAVERYDPDGGPWVEFRLRRKSGEYHWFYTRSSRRSGSAAGSVLRLTGVTVDIQERKEAERERERLLAEVAAERARVTAILNQLPVSVVLADIRSGAVLHYNDEAERQFGSTLAAMDDQAFQGCQLVHADGGVVQAAGSALRRALLGGEAVSGAELHCLREGRARCFAVNAGPVFEGDGEARIAVSVFSDVHALKQLQRTLNAEKERAMVTLSSIGDAVISTDAAGTIVEFNPAAERLTEWRPEDAVGRYVGDVLHIVDDQTRLPLDSFIESCLRDGRASNLSPRAVLISRSGRFLSIEDVAAPIRLADGAVVGLVVVFRDVTESRRVLRALTHQATHDALTELVNRAEFENRVKRVLDHALEFRNEGALLFMDLDQFKIVNDTCGHKAGDELLRQLSQRFRTQVRERDTLARLGGDEFGLLVEHCAFDEAVVIARKMLETTREFQFPFEGRMFRVGVSIGLVPITPASGSAQQLMQRADHACYIAKEGGRNRVHIQREGDAQLALRQSDMDWVSRVGDALHDGGLQLFRQTILPLGGSGGLHYEILLRLRDGPDRLIPPGAFLPAVERYDMMPAVDRWVLTHTVDWLSGHPRHLADLDLCAINLSARALSDIQFQEYAIQVLDTMAVPAEKLCFEITETAAIAQLQTAATFIRRLKQHGCRFALDDFGTGMASFSYLKSLPVDFIKIDGSFVSAIRDSEVDAEMVRSVNRIGHIMGKQTVAEWVTDEQTMAMLSQIGVDYVQGYWISPPQPLAA